MKFDGETHTGRNARPYPIRRNGKTITLQCTALPMNFREEVEKAIPHPAPGVTFARDPRTGRFATDADGNVLKVINDHEPAHRAERVRVNNLRYVCLVYEILANDPHTAFDTERPNAFGDRAFAEAIEREMIEGGFTDAEIVGILGTAGQAEADAQAVDEARENLSPTASAETGGPSTTTPGEA